MAAGDSSGKYAGVLDCFVKTARNDGLLVSCDSVQSYPGSLALVHACCATNLGKVCGWTSRVELFAQCRKNAVNASWFCFAISRLVLRNHNDGSSVVCSVDLSCFVD